MGDLGMLKSILGGLCILSFLVLPVDVSALHLNEIRTHQADVWDYDEYFELCGDPGESLVDYCFIVVNGEGVVTTTEPLWGFSIMADGFLALGEWDSFAFEDEHRCTGYNGYVEIPMSQPGGLCFYDSGCYTYLLVATTNIPGWGSDLDTDDDGIFDAPPWEEIIDSVAVIDPLSDEQNVYSDVVIGPMPDETIPGHIIFCDGS